MIPYAEARSSIQTGDILLFEGTSLFGRLIRWATKSPYCHVALARWDTGRLMVYQSMEGHGVETVPASIMVPSQVVCVLRCPVALEPSLWAEALDTLGSPYSWASILGIAWRILLGRFGFKADRLADHKGQFICSEYVAACLEAGGYRIPWDGLGFIAPSDFAEDMRLEVIAWVGGN